LFKLENNARSTTENFEISRSGSAYLPLLANLLLYLALVQESELIVDVVVEFEMDYEFL